MDFAFLSGWDVTFIQKRERRREREGENEMNEVERKKNEKIRKRVEFFFTYRQKSLQCSRPKLYDEMGFRGLGSIGQVGGTTR